MAERRRYGKVNIREKGIRRMLKILLLRWKKRKEREGFLCQKVHEDDLTMNECAEVKENCRHFSSVTNEGEK